MLLVLVVVAQEKRPVQVVMAVTAAPRPFLESCLVAAVAVAVVLLAAALAALAVAVEPATAQAQLPQCCPAVEALAAKVTAGALAFDQKVTLPVKVVVEAAQVVQGRQQHQVQAAVLGVLAQTTLFEQAQTKPVQAVAAVDQSLTRIPPVVPVVVDEVRLVLAVQQALAASTRVAAAVAEHPTALKALPAEALVLWLLDIGLHDGSLCTNRRTGHGAHSHRGEQQRHLG
jgi:hypothetical protein